MKVTIDETKAFANIWQHQLKPEAIIDGVKPILREYLLKGLIIPRTSLCNTPVSLVRQSNGKGWRSVRDLRAPSNFAIPCHPVALNLHTLLSSVPPDTTCFSVTDRCSAFSSIPMEKDSQYLFAFTWEDRQYTWTVTPQGCTQSPTYFSQIPNVDLADTKPPNNATLIHYVDDGFYVLPPR